MAVIQADPVNGVCSTTAIPIMQWAQLFTKHSSAINYTQIPVRSISPDEILVQIKYSGVCQSDLHAWKGDWPLETKESRVGGHEGAGVVVARGNNVRRVSVGDRVGVPWINETCGSCEFCNEGDEQLCFDAQNSGYTVDGTFQQFCVCRATNAVRIPDGISLEAAAAILCAGGSAYRAVKECHLKPEQTIEIAGADGALGTLACQYAQALGYRVLALSTGPSKKAMLLDEIGVDYFVDATASHEDLTAEIQRLTGGGPHAAIVTASAQASIGQTLQFVRPKGTVVVVGLSKNPLIQADVFSAISKQKMLKGSYVGSSLETEEALAVYVQSRLSVQYQTYPLEELPMVFEIMEQGKMQGPIVLEMPTLEAPAAPKYNIGTYLAYRLEEIGIKDYFVVPGDFNLILLDQILKNDNLRMVGCCNELNAGYAADGYARTSPSKVAVVFVTFMVGGLSLLNAIAGAYSDGLRVIVVSGAPASHTYGQDSLIHHTLGLKDQDQALRMFEQVTTASVRLQRGTNPSAVLDQTVVRCLEDSLPVYIEIPSDMFEDLCDPPGPLPLLQPRLSVPDHLYDALSRFRAYWEIAQNPIIIVGPLARHSLTPDTLISLIEKLGCPVFCQPDAKSLVPESHLQFQGTFWGIASDPDCIEKVIGSDLWVGIGTRWGDFSTLQKPVPPELHLQSDYLRTADGKSVDRITMAELCHLVIHSDIPTHNRTVLPSPTSIPGAHPENDNIHDHHIQPLTTASILKVIESILQPNDTLIAEAGDSWFNAQTIHLPDGVDYQMQMIYGSIGWSLPATLGCQLARPQGRTILMIGDGSFQMTAQELSTMIRLRTNAVIFIFNNLGYRIESAIHDGPYNYLSNWNYAQLASSMQNISHSPGNGNKFLTEQEKHYENINDPVLVSMRIKTQADLLIAYERILSDREKLFLLECCIHPWDISEGLRRFGRDIGAGCEE